MLLKPKLGMSSKLTTGIFKSTMRRSSESKRKRNPRKSSPMKIRSVSWLPSWRTRLTCKRMMLPGRSPLCSCKILLGISTYLYLTRCLSKWKITWQCMRWNWPFFKSSCPLWRIMRLITSWRRSMMSLTTQLIEASSETTSTLLELVWCYTKPLMISRRCMDTPRIVLN